MLLVVDHIGKKFCDSFRDLKEIFVFIYLAFRLTLPLKWNSFKTILFNVVSQIYFTGFLALPLMTFIALAVGSITVLQTSAQLSVFGSPEMMGNILVVAIVRELGPLLTSLIVIARSGTAVASELGNMQVNKELDSLRVMSIEPISYVVFPRILGGIISLLCLAFYFNTIALLGGFFVASFVSDLTFVFYVDVISQAIGPYDFSFNILKNVISGFIIFTIACDQGFKVKNGPHEVPVATTNSVVYSIMTVVAFNLGLTVFIFAKDLV
jgi:phospholipid/cholesterol/gamma-HCH transport system permease protein